MAAEMTNPDTPKLCELKPNCPICEGNMELVYSRHNQQVCVCADCHTGITVPGAAFEVARLKREGKCTAL